MRNFLAGAVLCALLPVPAFAQALQFDTPQEPAAAAAAPQSAPKASPLGWLAHKPATMMDLGLFSLTQTAEKAARLMPDIGAVIAEYSPQKEQILLSFASQSAYSEANCEFVARKVRDQMFPQRNDPAFLGDMLQLPFMSAGSSAADVPQGLGQALVTGVIYVVYQSGGMCTLPLLGEKAAFWTDPNAKPAPQPAPPVAATPNGAKDAAKAPRKAEKSPK